MTYALWNRSRIVCFTTTWVRFPVSINHLKKDYCCDNVPALLCSLSSFSHSNEIFLQKYRTVRFINSMKFWGHVSLVLLAQLCIQQTWIHKILYQSRKSKSTVSFELNFFPIWSRYKQYACVLAKLCSYTGTHL